MRARIFAFDSTMYMFDLLNKTKPRLYIHWIQAVDEWIKRTYQKIFQII